MTVFIKNTSKLVKLTYPVRSQESGYLSRGDSVIKVAPSASDVVVFGPDASHTGVFPS